MIVETTNPHYFRITTKPILYPPLPFEFGIAGTIHCQYYIEQNTIMIQSVSILNSFTLVSNAHSSLQEDFFYILSKTGITRRNLEHQVISQAIVDKDFKNRLIHSPNSVIEKEFQIKLPTNFKIVVLEEKDGTKYMILPYNPFENNQGVSEIQEKNTITRIKDRVRSLLQQIRNTFLDEESTIEIISEAWSKTNFRSNLIERPVETINTFLGTNYPVEINAICMAEDFNTIYIVLPEFDNTNEETSLQSLNIDLSSSLLKGGLGCQSTDNATNCTVSACKD